MKKYTIDEIRTRITPIAKKYGVVKLALFGSYARGDNHDNSDIDFLIEKGMVKDLIRFCEFALELEDELELKVDLMTYDGMLENLISEYALKDEVVLYEQR